MPKYDFKCVDGHVVERVILFSDVPDLDEKTECEFQVYEYEGQPGLCGMPAYRQLGLGVSFINNKVMSPPSKRAKPGHLSV